MSLLGFILLLAPGVTPFQLPWWCDATRRQRPALGVVPVRRRQSVVLQEGRPAKRDGRRKQVASNRKARFDYHIVRTMEAGISLKGTEVKSCRNNNVNLRDGFARVESGSVWLHNVDIAAHQTTANYFQHDAKARRRLLLHKSEIRKLDTELHDTGTTLVPLSFYFNDKNLLKVELALCKGKNVRDKRQDIKERDDKRMLSRVSKNFS